MARNLRGYAIFCDDIRQEVGGKTSYIGVYQDNLIVNAEFPIVLPKFGISIVIFFTPTKARQALEVPFKIFFPGDDPTPSLEGQIPIADNTNALMPSDYVRPVSRATANVILAPLQLKNPGLIRVEAYLDRVTIDLGTLRVDQVDPTITQASTVAPSA
jgi:hypothetical protein